jgi:hypothetical protein
MASSFLNSTNFSSISFQSLQRMWTIRTNSIFQRPQQIIFEEIQLQRSSRAQYEDYQLFAQCLFSLGSR